MEAPGWSRARLVGQTQAEFPAPPALAEDGSVYFALVSGAEDANGLQLVKLDELANPVWQVDLASAEELIEHPMAWVLSDQVAVLWVDSDVLYQALLNADGEVLSGPQALSGSNLASTYEAAVSPQGELAIAYSGLRSHPGLYFQTSEGSLLVDEAGYSPQVQFDDGGGLHLAWMRNRSGSVDREIYYAYFPDGQYAPGQTQLVHTATVSVTVSVNGFGMGLEDDQVYIYWSELTRAGLSAGGVEARYINFTYSGEGSVTERPLRAPNGYHLAYSVYPGVLQAGERAVLEEQEVFPMGALDDLAASPGSAGELAVAFRARLPYLRNKSAQQVGLVYLQDGQFNTSQLLSFTPTVSERPAVTHDADGYLYFTWLEGGGIPPFDVYFASTAPQLVENLAELDREDYGRLAGETAFGLLSGILLVPFIFGFALLPVLFLLATGRFRREGEWIASGGTLVTLALSILLYWLSKLAIFPDVATYVPFSAWIPGISGSLALALRIGVPLVASLLALLAAYRLTYARERLQPLFFLLIFIILDGFITIAVYGVIFYAAI